MWSYRSQMENDTERLALWENTPRDPGISVKGGRVLGQVTFFHKVTVAGQMAYQPPHYYTLLMITVK